MRFVLSVAFCIALMSPSSAPAQNDGPVRQIVRGWDCDSARVDSLMSEARAFYRGRGTPIPIAGEAVCDALARIGRYLPASEMGDKRVVEMNPYFSFVAKRANARSRIWVVTEILWRL